MKRDKLIFSMTKHCLECAIWADSPQDEDWDEEASEMFGQLLPLVTNFFDKAFEILKGTPEQDGHDLWLSMMGHGAGFFDREYYTEEEITKLNELSIESLRPVMNGLYVENRILKFDYVKNLTL